VNAGEVLHSAMRGAIAAAAMTGMRALTVSLGLVEQPPPQAIAERLLEMTSDPLVVLALLNLFFLVIGLFLHSAAAIILVVPIVMP